MDGDCYSVLTTVLAQAPYRAPGTRQPSARAEWTRLAPTLTTFKSSLPGTHSKTCPGHGAGSAQSVLPADLGSTERGGASRPWVPPTPGLLVLGQLVTQPRAGRLFGGDNDRAAAGVSAPSPRGPLPWPAQGKTKPSESGTQTPNPGQARPRGHAGRPKGGGHGPRGPPNAG